MNAIPAVIFDIGDVLLQWHPRRIYERLISDDRALDAFMADVVNWQWHQQHDRGLPFAETAAGLAARFPEHAALIARYGPHFHESLTDPVPGMPELVRDLDAAGVPLFAITNFSAEFFPEVRRRHDQLFAPFRDIVVSGEVGLVKPDPAIYALALARFGLDPQAAVFVDDVAANVEAAGAMGLGAVLFRDAASTRAALAEAGLPIPSTLHEMERP